MYLITILSYITFHISVIFCAPRDTSLTLDLIFSPPGDYAFEITIGTPPQYFECYLSTVLPKLYLPQYSSSGTLVKSSSQLMFNPRLSSTVQPKEPKPTSFSEISPTSKGYIATDTLTLSHRHVLDKFNFISLTQGSNIDNTFACSIGFEYLFKESNDNSFSIINSLYNSGQIYIRFFYIIKNQYESSFNIGKFPPHYNEKEYRKDYKKCSLLTSKTHPHLWQCNLNAIYFSEINEIIELNKPLTWSFGGTVNCVDNSIYKIIKDKYFRTALDSQECVELNGSYRTFIKCNAHFTLRNNPIISYIFGKWNMKFNMNKLFSEVEDGKKWFSIMKCDEGDFGFNWSIGLFHIKKGMFIFDKENQVFGYKPIE